MLLGMHNGLGRGMGIGMRNASKGDSGMMGMINIFY
jgi:hypothetical protein